MKRLQGKNIVITGGTSGIGEAAAYLLSEHGANIIVSGRNQERGKEIVEDIKNKNGEAYFVACDVRHQKDADSLMKTAQDKFSRIDCLFNNAGIDGEVKLFEDSTEENWDNVINTNLKGVWYCMKSIFHHIDLAPEKRTHL